MEGGGDDDSTPTGGGGTAGGNDASWCRGRALVMSCSGSSRCAGQPCCGGGGGCAESWHEMGGEWLFWNRRIEVREL